MTCSATYLLTQGDIDAGGIDNSAVAEGDAPSGTMVVDTSDTSNPGDPNETDADGNTPQDSTFTLIPENPSIEIEKSSMLSLGVDGVAGVGDTVYYSFVVENTGNVSFISLRARDRFI